MNLYTLEVIEKRSLAPDIWEFDAELIHPQELEFKAGQCVGFLLAPLQQKRLYSIASKPSSKNKLTFCIDVSPMGDGSKFVLALEPKSEFVAEGPYGGFTVPEDLDKDLLFIATGVGVAPFRSMILDLLEGKKFAKKITLLFGVRSEENKFYFDLFSRLADEHRNFEFIPALSQPKKGSGGYTGRVTRYLQENRFDSAKNVAYVCGGIEMIKDVRKILNEQGFGPRDVKIEIFE